MKSARDMLLLSLLLLLVVACASPPQNTANICSMFEDRRSWYRAAMRAEERWNVPVAVSMAFIQQESGFEGRARPPRSRILGFIPGPRPSDAFGYAQALESTWDDYKEAAGNWGARRSSFEDAMDFVGWYNSNSYRINAIRRDDAYSLYLAYHEGNGGFARRTYDAKPWLLDVANKVQASALVYERQFQECERVLGRGWFRRLFS